VSEAKTGPAVGPGPKVGDERKCGQKKNSFLRQRSVPFKGGVQKSEERESWEGMCVELLRKGKKKRAGTGGRANIWGRTGKKFLKRGLRRGNNRRRKGLELVKRWREHF